MLAMPGMLGSPQPQVVCGPGKKNKMSVHRSHRGQGLSSPGSSWLLGILPALDVAALSSERTLEGGGQSHSRSDPLSPTGAHLAVAHPARTGAQLPHVLCDPVAHYCKAHPG